MTSARKTPWILILFMALVAAAVSSAGMYFFMKNQGAVLGSRKESQPQAPLLVTVAPMTVNLRNDRNEQSLLYVGFALEVGNESTQSFLQQYMPQVRSRILTLLSGQDSSQLISAEGKTALAAKVREVLRQSLSTPQSPVVLLNVLYTDFIVQ